MTAMRVTGKVVTICGPEMVRGSGYALSSAAKSPTVRRNMHVYATHIGSTNIDGRTQDSATAGQMIPGRKTRKDGRSENFLTAKDRVADVPSLK